MHKPFHNLARVAGGLKGKRGGGKAKGFYIGITMGSLFTPCMLMGVENKVH